MLMQLSSVTLTMSKRTDSLGFEDVSGHACEESGELAQTDERANVRTGAGGPSNRASKQPMEKWTPGERGAARRRGGRRERTQLSRIKEGRKGLRDPAKKEGGEE